MTAELVSREWSTRVTSHRGGATRGGRVEQGCTFTAFACQAMWHIKVLRETRARRSLFATTRRIERVSCPGGLRVFAGFVGNALVWCLDFEHFIFG